MAAEIRRKNVRTAAPEETILEALQDLVIIEQRQCFALKHNGYFSACISIAPRYLSISMAGQVPSC
jgi:hypothetical protein